MNKTLVIPSYLQKRKPPINNHDIIGEAGFIRTEEILPDIFIFELRNCYVTPYGIALHNFKIVKASIYSMFYKHNYYLTFLKKFLLGKIRTISGISAIAHNAYYSNYYHWCAETLPRLFMLKDIAKNVTILMHENLPHFAKEYLSLFEFKNIIYINDDELIKVETLLLPMHPADGLFHNGSIMSKMSTWLKMQASAISSKTFNGFENIYISRTSAAYRRILNENEVIELLKNYNFKIIDFETYSVFDQIKLVSHAKNLIGIHGAGLVNILYMPTNGFVIDLIHEYHFDPAFYNLASSLDINFVLLQCKAANTDSRGVAYDDFTVDIERLTYLLKKYMFQCEVS